MGVELCWVVTTEPAVHVYAVDECPMPGRLLVVLLAPVAAVRFGITPDFAVPRAAVSCYGGGGGGSRRGRGRDGAKSAAGRALLTRLEALPSTKAVPVDTIALHRIIRSVDHGLGGSLLTNVLSALKRKNRWQLAIAIGKLLEGTIAPSAQRRGRQRDDMCSRNNGEEQRFNLDSALAPPLETIHYNVLIGCCARPREWREALALLERMRKRGVPRETITYNSILDVMKKAGRWKLALRLLREMRAEKVPPNTITFSSAISACAQAGEWQRALQLLAYMRESGVMPNTITYSAAIAACERLAPRSVQRGASGARSPCRTLSKPLSRRRLRDGRTPDHWLSSIVCTSLSRLHTSARTGRGGAAGCRYCATR